MKNWSGRYGGLQQGQESGRHHESLGGRKSFIAEQDIPLGRLIARFRYISLLNTVKSTAKHQDRRRCWLWFPTPGIGKYRARETDKWRSWNARWNVGLQHPSQRDHVEIVNWCPSSKLCLLASCEGNMIFQKMQWGLLYSKVVHFLLCSGNALDSYTRLLCTMTSIPNQAL